MVEQRLTGVEGLDLLGFVEDMAATVRQAAVNLAPIRFGTGTRIKVLDALAQGGAVVSTTLGCEGHRGAKTGSTCGWPTGPRRLPRRA